MPSRVQDKRPQIELDAVRQSIFDGDARRTTEVYPKKGDAKSMKPAHMLRVLDTCKYQISREDYSKPSASSSEVGAPVGHTASSSR